MLQMKPASCRCVSGLIRATAAAPHPDPETPSHPPSAPALAIVAQICRMLPTLWIDYPSAPLPHNLSPPFRQVPVARTARQSDFHGSRTGRIEPLKSPTLRVTSVRSWALAVAAM